MKSSIQKWTVFEKINLILFVVLSVWWAVLFFWFGAELEQQNLYWAASYEIIAWGGCIYGLYMSRVWGGYKSSMGRAVMFFSLGLLLQGFGQATFSFYTTILHIDIPYPSISDVGYFGSVIFYIAGIIMLAKVSELTYRLKENTGKVLVLFLPIIVLVTSYYFFLKDYEFDWSAPLRIFLDFGYPLGEAIYVSIAVLCLVLTWHLLGGVMRKSFVLVMIALCAQYVAEFNFLFRTSRSIWVNGGYGDFLYLFAYFLMTLALINMGKSYHAIHDSK